MIYLDYYNLLGLSNKKKPRPLKGRGSLLLTYLYRLNKNNDPSMIGAPI